MRKVLFQIATILLYTAVILPTGNATKAQSLPSSRSTDWTIAGLRDTTYPTNLIIFSGDGTGAIDNAPALATLLGGITQPTIIQIEEGNFLFNSQINLPSNIVLRGKGAGITTLTFNLGGLVNDCINITGSEIATEYALTADAFKDDYTITLASTSAFAVGDYIRFIKDDATLVFDSWAERRTGQISRISAVTPTTLTLESPLRMDFLTTENPRVRKSNQKTNVGLECFTLVRTDQVVVVADRNKASKIRFNQANNCWVKGVESINCNYAHVEALYCTNLLVTGCYFHDAFEFGDGGRAYGVMLHFATSESRIENCIFKTLRHALIVQAGANGNSFSYNYSTDAKKTFLSFTVPSEDLVCHGNYPYLNLFEGNVAEWPKVDASHGSNGPYNTFFRNRATVAAFSVTGTSSGNQNNDQNFVGNEGSASLAGANHYEFLNSWNGTTGTLETSLSYAFKPNFLNAAQFGAIGYGYYGSTAKNPANLRFDAATYINETCGKYIWNGTAWQHSFSPNGNSQYFNIHVDDGQICALTSNVSANRIILQPGGRLELQNTATLTLADSIFLLADVVKYSQFNGNASFPARWQMAISQPGWHHITAPLASCTLAQLETDIDIWYSSASKPSVFTWDPTLASYAPIANNTFDFGTIGINLWISNQFVKAGKGINNDGQLPVILSVKGTLNNGSVTNSQLGYGTASNVVGSDADGWNYIVNPYPCSINLDDVFANVPANYQVGAHIYNTASNSFEVRTLSSINNGNATGIAPGQSFFIKLDAGADLNTGFFNFSNIVRTLDEPPLYKSSTSSITFNVTRDGKVAQGHLYYQNDASLNYNSKTDISVFSDTTDTNLYFAFLKRESHKMRKLSHAGFPLNSTPVVMPIAIYSSMETFVELTSVNNTTGKTYWLEDSYQAKFIPLENSVALHLSEGWNINRFYLHEVPIDFDSNDILALITMNAYQVSISYTKTLSPNSAIRIVDISGREILALTEFSANGTRVFTFRNPLKSGVYLIQLRESGEWKSLKLVL